MRTKILDFMIDTRRQRRRSARPRALTKHSMVCAAHRLAADGERAGVHGRVSGLSKQGEQRSGSHRLAACEHGDDVRTPASHRPKPMTPFFMHVLNPFPGAPGSQHDIAGGTPGPGSQWPAGAHADGNPRGRSGLPPARRRGYPAPARQFDRPPGVDAGRRGAAAAGPRAAADRRPPPPVAKGS
jgi:hypothetical protein